MVRVSFNALEKVVVSSIEQFGDDRYFFIILSTTLCFVSHYLLLRVAVFALIK